MDVYNHCQLHLCDMVKKSVLSDGDEERCILTKNKLLLQTNKIFSTVSPFCGLNASVSTVLEVFSEKINWNKL